MLTQIIKLNKLGPNRREDFCGVAPVKEPMTIDGRTVLTCAYSGAHGLATGFYFIYTPTLMTDEEGLDFLTSNGLCIGNDEDED